MVDLSQMANGTDSEQFLVLSGVRTGHKREFAFALKVQSELSGSLGRTRARKFQNSPIVNAVSENSSNKRFKNSYARKETKNHDSKPQIEEEVKREMDKSLTGEKLKVDLAKTVSEEEPKVDLPEPTSQEERKNDVSEEPKVDLPEPMSEEEPKNDVSEELKVDLPEPTREEERKNNDGSEEFKNDLPEPMSEEEPKNDVSEELKVDLPEPTREEERKNNDGSEESKNDLPEPMSEEEPKNDVSEELKVDLPEPTREEERKNNDGSEESKNDLPEPMSEEERKNDVSEELKVDLPEPMSEEERKNNGSEESKNDKGEFPIEREKFEIVKEEGSCMESPMLIDDESKTQHVLPEKPLRRFTRSALKSKAKPMEISGSTNGGTFGSEDVKERKNIELKEDSLCDSVKSSIEENRQSDLVTPATPAREVKTEEAKEVGEQPKNDPIRSKTEEGICAEFPMVIDCCNKVQNVSLGRSPRRFTRSALKPKVETMEVCDSAGGDSVTAADAKDETSVKGGSVISDYTKTGDIVAPVGEVKTTDVVSPLIASPKKKLEMKMSKKITLNNIPSKVRELLDTGMLEGLAVKYLLRGKNGIRGVIKDSGILCSCASCNECKVITPIQFEQHAGSLNKRPADYIYLENGNSLRDVMNACKDAPLDTLEATIQRAVSSSPVKDATVSQKDATICQNCKRPFTPSRTRRSMLLCSSCIEAKESQESLPCMTGATAKLSKPVSTPKSSSSASKCILSPKSKGNILSPKSKGIMLSPKSKGKITRKDLRLHKLVFEEGGLPEGTEVAYYARGQKLIEGYKKGAGIFCRCCNSEVSPSQFEAHAGWASRRKPYLHIYTSNGVSLHELSISLSKGRKLSSKDNDDLCTICADGGDLLLCDGCPRAFHRDCVSLSSIPRGDWYCKYCQNMFQREKFGDTVNARAAGRVSGVDPIEQISQRCIRIVNTIDAEVGGCTLCRGHGFSKSRFGPQTVLLCDQCEKEFHVGCLRDHKMADLKELPKGKWFCCMDCNRINAALQKLLVRGPEKLPDSLSNIIKKKHEEKGSDDTDLDVRWRLLSGKIACPETRLLLSKAVAIFHDRFDPIVDSTTGRDLIPSMVYGRNIRDQEFGGMYCAVLTLNSTVVSAGILRIFGTEVAELPLVATTSDNQGQGFFQSLFSCIERLLGFLRVKNLVLPAADEAESIWTQKFGFTKIAPDELSKLRTECQLTTFQGTSMLQKPVPKCRVIGLSSADS